MLEFDLVPPDYRAAARAQRWLKAAGAAAGAIVVATAICWGTLSWATTRVKADIAATEQRIQEDVNARKVLDQLRAQIKNIKTEQTFTGTLASGPDIERVIAALDASINDEVWLNKLEVIRSRDKASGPSALAPGLVLASLPHKKSYWRLGATVKFSGNSYSHSALSNFVGALEQNDALRQVELNKSRVRTEDKRDIIDFELSAQIDMTGAAP